MDEGLQFLVRSKNSTLQREGDPKIQGTRPIMARTVGADPAERGAFFRLPVYERKEILFISHF